MTEKKVEIIFETDEYLVINKPAGMVVNRSESVRGETLQDIAGSEWINLTEEEGQLFRERLGMVHRLDKDTSGVMVWAKTEKAMEKLMEQFKNRVVKKKYLALVHGRMIPRSGELSLPLGRLAGSGRFGVVLGGKMSKTAYLVKRRLVNKSVDSERLTLVELSPLTGRTHQLRVVLKHLGFPIVGDKLYLSKKRIKADRKWCGRLFLHAESLMFVDWKTGRDKVFRVPLSDDLKLVLGKLEDE